MLHLTCLTEGARCVRHPFGCAGARVRAQGTAGAAHRPPGRASAHHLQVLQPWANGSCLLLPLWLLVPAHVLACFAPLPRAVVQCTPTTSVPLIPSADVDMAVLARRACSGRVLDDSQTLSSAGVADGHTLHLVEQDPSQHRTQQAQQQSGAGPGQTFDPAQLLGTLLGGGASGGMPGVEMQASWWLELWGMLQIAQ